MQKFDYETISVAYNIIKNYEKPLEIARARLQFAAMCGRIEQLEAEAVYGAVKEYEANKL
jgi:hypothetical protein